MIYSAKLLTLGQTAHVLSHHLGMLRNWVNFLTDCIRGHQHIAGVVLMPSARLQDARALRPAYTLESISSFIKAVRAVMLGVKPCIKPVAVRLDTAKDWRINKFDRDGNPVARHQGMPHACNLTRA